MEIAIVPPSSGCYEQKGQPPSLVPRDGVRAQAGTGRIKTMDEALVDNFFHKLQKCLVFILSHV